MGEQSSYSSSSPLAVVQCHMLYGLSSDPEGEMEMTFVQVRIVDYDYAAAENESMNHQGCLEVE